MQVIRIGSKLISREKIDRVIDETLQFRVQGYSQQEVANRLNLDRTFVSRLEKMGEIRKGRRIAVIGFPIQNTVELKKMLQEEGVEYTLLLTDKERWEFVQSGNGVDLLNSVMKIITDLRIYDTVLVIASNYRVRLCQAILDKEVVGFEIGKSPIEDDKYVPVEEIREIIRQIMI